MNRVHKKCLIASAAFHGTLLLCVVIGSAFVAPAPPPVETHTIELVNIPDILVDQAVAGGGNPAAAAPPPPSQERIPPPRPRQPEPEPIRLPEPEPEPVRQPEPEPEREPVRQPEPEPEPEPEIEPDPEPARPRVKVNIDTTVRLSPRVDRTPAPRETAPRFDPSQLAEQLASRISNKASSSSTTVEIPGPGGPAYASYAAYLREIYRRSWIPPAGGSPNDVVAVEITVSRAGRVLAGKIIKKSGNVSLDQSVQRTLDRVKVLRPLPEGTTDTKRTFRINFNLDF